MYFKKPAHLRIRQNSGQFPGVRVQVAVDTEHHLIIVHEVTNSGTDRAQLANMGKQAKAVLGVDKLEAVADRGYYTGEEIKACADADIAVILPKPNTTGMEAKGKFGKHDFAYLAKQDVYRCPAGQLLGYWLTTVDGERTIRRYAHRSRLQADLSMLRWSHDHYRGLRVRRTDSAILTGNIPTCRQIGGLRLAQRASLRFCATKAQSTKQMV